MGSSKKCARLLFVIVAYNPSDAFLRLKPTFAIILDIYFLTFNLRKIITAQKRVCSIHVQNTVRLFVPFDQNQRLAFVFVLVWALSASVGKSPYTDTI